MRIDGVKGVLFPSADVLCDYFSFVVRNTYFQLLLTRTCSCTS